jgi:hypothetical protein
MNTNRSHFVGSNNESLDSLTDILITPFMNRLNEANLEVEFIEYMNSSNQTYMCPPLDMPRVNYMFMLLYAVVCIVGMLRWKLIFFLRCP